MKALICNGPATPRAVALFAGLAVLLAACGTSNPFRKDEPPPEPNVLPTSFRAKMLEFLQTQLTDPTGVRDASISEPKLQPVGAESRYVACVRYNSKNGYGQYTGIQEYVAIYF